MWVRGLKLACGICEIVTDMSHPVWVRGLKLCQCSETARCAEVAPRVGAWIETCMRLDGMTAYLVAPRVGAWIETRHPDDGNPYHYGTSHPVWVRGLKHIHMGGIFALVIVAPRVGAWIETRTFQM